MMFGIGATELLIILAIVMLLFGATRVRKVMSEMGKGVSAFKEGMNEGEQQTADSDKKD